MATNYGKDTSCTSSLRTGRLSTGTRLLAEAAFRRLITPNGSLRGGPEEEIYGLDLLDLIGTTNTTTAVATLPGKIQNELLKDERFFSASATVTVVQSTPGVELVITIEVETAEGTFNLQVSVDEVSVELIGISA